MKRLVAVVLLCFSVSIYGQDIPLPGDSLDAAPGDEKLYSFGGYVENTFSGEQMKRSDDTSLLNETRARINLDGKPNSRMDYALSLVGTMYSGNTNIQLIDYYPENQYSSASVPEAYEYTFEDELFVQEAFGSLYFDNFMLRLGRQKYYSGNGYAYNPSDFFNSKSPVDPSYEYDGIDALLMSADLPGGTKGDFCFLPGEVPEKSSFQGSFDGYLGVCAFGLQYTSVYVERTDYESYNDVDAEAAAASGDTSALDPSEYKVYARWHYAGGKFSTEINDIHLYGEGGYVIARPDGDEGNHDVIGRSHERILWGADYTFDMQLYVIMEYLRYGLGDDSSDDISFTDRTEYYSGQRLSLAKNTLFTGASYPVTDLSDLGLYVISEIDTRSLILNPQYTWDITEGTSLMCNVQLPVGDEESIGKAGAAGFVRLKFSF